VGHGDRREAARKALHGRTLARSLGLRPPFAFASAAADARVRGMGACPGAVRQRVEHTCCKSLHTSIKLPA
jgi:hypothetical protein